MKYSKLECMKDKTYYTINLWTDRNKMGTDFKNEYIRINNAIKTVEKLKNSGVYECIIIRKHEVTYRDQNNEFSCSSVFRVWEKSGQTIRG